MQDKIKNIARNISPTKLTELTDYLLKDEAISGKLILGATVLALIAANTALSAFYADLWSTQLSIGLGEWTLSKELQSWVSEGLMAIFFLVVGLELKREVVNGELRRFKTAILPVVAAIGGMLVPALIYAAINVGKAGADGWAIPMATDIAFAIAILAFVGNGIPRSVRLFLLALAIVDDIGAVIVIALFYNTGINPSMLGLAACVVAVLIGVQKIGRLNMPIFIVGSLLIWLAVDKSGVHASIAGVIIGLLAPLSGNTKNAKPIAERLERSMIPLSTLFVVPLFAFASTGIVLSFDSLKNEGALGVAAGIILGLVAGKFVGIVGTSWLMIKLKAAELPMGASWNHLMGVGLLAGIGFTVSIFVTNLAFTEEELISAAKLSIFIASGISGTLGVITLRNYRKAKLEQRHPR